MRPSTTTALFLTIFGLSCGDGGGGCKNPHAGLNPGAPIQVSPENLGCAASSDPACTVKDEDSMILLGEDQKFYVAWLSNRTENNDDIYIIRSDDGTHWSDPFRVTTSTDADWYPTLIEHQNSRGRFHIVWMRQQINAPFERHLFFNSSPDGVTWDSANEVQVTTGAVDDFAPFLVANNDQLLIYFDNLIGRSSSNTRDLFVVQSTDGGATWGTPQELTALNSTTENDSFPFIQQRPFSHQLMMMWVRYNAAATGILGAFDPSADLVYSTSNDGITWDSVFSATPGDTSDSTIDTLPALYTANDQEIITWIQGVGDEPHIMEIPFSFPNTYPAGIRDETLSGGAKGYSVRVTRTLKPNTYVRTFVSPDKKIYMQVF